MQVMVEVWKLARLTYQDLTFDDGFIYLGKVDGRQVLQDALGAIHCIAWKFIVIAFTQVETKGSKFDARAIWRQTLTRVESRVSA